jgi:hypothetical protein
MMRATLLQTTVKSEAVARELERPEIQIRTLPNAREPCGEEINRDLFR